MSEKRVEFRWNGMDIEASVYLGSTQSFGPDPSLVEDLEIVGVYSVKELSDYLAERLYDEEGCISKALEEACDDDAG